MKITEKTRNLKEIEGAGKKTRKTRAGRARPTLYTQALTPDRPPQAEITGNNNNDDYFEGVCGRATNVILAPSAGCKGFVRRSVTSVPARKAEQSGRVPGSSLTIICCAGISCVGCRKLAYSHGSFMPRELKMVPMGTRDSALRMAKK